jgi:opacity protein-like surface antigen
MRKSAIFAVASLAAAFLIASPAGAADMAVKAPVYSVPSNPCTPTSCTGFYLGAAIGGVGSNADIVGNGVNGSVFAGGGIPMAVAGYQYAKGNWFFGGEVAVGGQISTKATVNGVSGNENGLFSYQIAKVGGNLSGILGNDSAPITIPSTLQKSLISPYVLVGAVERQFASGWATGAGATFDISSKMFLDVKYMYVNYGPSRNGNLQLNSENLILTGINYKFNY